MPNESITTGIYIDRDLHELIQSYLHAANCRSPSEFIEKAVAFYCGYLRAEAAQPYLSRVLVTTMRGMLDSFEDRQASLLFKLAVEMAMMMHVTAAANEVEPKTLTRLRGRCVQEVKALRGRISFDDAWEHQKS